MTRNIAPHLRIGIAAPYLTAIGLAILMLPNVQANNTLDSPGQNCVHLPVLAIALSVTAGDIGACMNFPEVVATSHDVVWIGTTAQGPVIVGLLTPIITGPQNLVGCTILLNNVADSGTVAVTQESRAAKLQMTGPECTGEMEVKFGTSAPLVVADILLPFFIRANDAITNQNAYACKNTALASSAFTEAQVCNIPFSGMQIWQCGASGTTLMTFAVASTVCLNPQIDNQNHLCPGGAYGSTCTNPTFNIAVLSWPTLNLAGTLSTTTTLSGTINIGSWPTLNLAGTVNTVTSGTLTVHQDPLSGTVSVSPLSGTLTVHQDPLSGTLAVTNSGSQSITLSGAVTVHQDPLSGTVSVSPLSGTLTVHQDPLSGNIGITSFPALTVHQDQACGATIACKVATNVTVNGNINSTTNAVFPSTLHLCGPATSTNPCPSIATASTAAFGADGLLDVFIMAAIGAWLWAASTLLPVRVLGIVVEFYAGFRAFTMRPQPYGHDAIAIFFWLLAAVFALHMSITMLRDNLKKRQAMVDPIEGEPA